MARVLDAELQEIYRNLEDERCCTVYAKDPRVFKADKILAIRANTNEQIEYCIKWTGYSAELNEWVAEGAVTPDLKRAFSIEKKRKVIKLLKQEKAKARVMRRTIGRTVRISTVRVLTSTPYVVPPKTRNAKLRMSSVAAEDCDRNGTFSSMSDESEPEIPQWITPNEDKDASMSDASSESDEAELGITKWTLPHQNNGGCGTLMSEASSESDKSGCKEPQQEDAVKKMKQDDGTLVSATLPSECTTEPTRLKSGQNSFESMTLVLESESDGDSFQKKNEPEEYLLGFNEQLEPVFTYV